MSLAAKLDALRENAACSFQTEATLARSLSRWTSIGLRISEGSGAVGIAAREVAKIELLLWLGIVTGTLPPTTNFRLVVGV
eukprot:530287-Amphidinium_carterae.2